MFTFFLVSLPGFFTEEDFTAFPGLVFLSPVISSLFFLLLSFLPLVYFSIRPQIKTLILPEKKGGIYPPFSLFQHNSLLIRS